MPYVRSRKLKTGTFHSVITGRHDKPIKCGRGPEALEYAQELVVELRKERRAAATGRPLPRLCLWTLQRAREAHLEDARRRGLRTALPQFHAQASKLESHWNNLARFFGAETSLDQITAARIRGYITAREKTVSAGVINQDLFAVLRPALALARSREESGYRGDPFDGMHELAAKPEREPIALPEKALRKVVRACWRRHKPLGAHVELLCETASRLREQPTVDGDLVRYPPCKRGIERVFVLEGRLPALVRARRTFSYLLWKEAAAAAGVPDLNPHDLRHSSLTILGKRPGMSLLKLQNYGGWKNPAMAAKYLHPGNEALRPVKQAFEQAREKPAKRRKRRKPLVERGEP